MPRPSGPGASTAFVVYTLLTLVLTWPIARGLARDVPGDLIDPLLNAWIVSWDAGHIARALTGDLGALGEYWHANVFAPHRFALAYSEHLTPQALQVLPVHLLSGNPILGYNLLFLSTFVLSAFGMFLLVREFTGSGAAGLLAGLAFGFAPYRMGNTSHLQVLSSAWMPFTLFFLRRFFVTGRTGPLAAGAASWIAQNLSCGYYLLFFSPVVALYLLWELTVRRLWTDRRTLTRLGAMLAGVAATTLPFLWPYLELRRLGFTPRSLAETSAFGADVYGFFTADVNLKIWGSIARAWPSAEGSLFPGLVVALLSAAAVADLWRRTGREALPASTRASRVLAVALAIASIVALALLLGWSLRIPASRPVLKITSLPRALIFAIAIGGALLAVSARARVISRRLLASPAGFFALVTLFAATLALGPDVYARGRLVADVAPYAALYNYVPGFDGLRVPARFGMVVAFGLAALAGLGGARLARQRRGGSLVTIACALIVVESCAAPIDINYNGTNYEQSGLAPLPDTLAVGRDASPVYAFVAGLPAASVLLELPLGEPAFDVRYMLYGLAHKRALVNGYSGGAPVEYQLLGEALHDTLTNPDRAWEALSDSAATHVIVHEGFYEPGRGPRISAWLAAHGAREVAVVGSDHVFEIAGRHPF